MASLRGAFLKLAPLPAGSWLRRWLYRMGGVKIGKGVYLARRTTVGSGASLGNRVIVATGASIGSGAVIGRGVEIRRNATIGPNVVIGDGCAIAEHALVWNCEIGERSFVDYGAVFTGSKGYWIRIGKQCYLGIYAILDGSGGLEIGDCVQIGGRIYTHSSVHQALEGIRLGVEDRKLKAPVKIENNVWIGPDVTVYPGVTIGHHSVVLPNSVVEEDVPSYSMVGGIPAELKRRIVMDEHGSRFERTQVRARA